MSVLFAYIATNTTADPYIPPATPDLRFLGQDVSDAFSALSGGYRIVGQLAFFPIQRSVAGYLLCDGREVDRATFPELYTYLGDTQGTPVDPANFVLPNFIGASDFTPSDTSDPETTDGGTTNTTGGGDVDSGGVPIHVRQPVVPI